MGIEQIQPAKTKALLPAFQFNWSQIGVKSIPKTQVLHNEPGAPKLDWRLHPGHPPW